MKTQLILILVIAFLGCSGMAADELRLNDSILLKSGTQLDGKIITRTNENGREFIVFKTTSGGILKLDSRSLVKRVYEIAPEYKERLARMDDLSPDQHWEMYEWCKNQGGATFKREMEHHLTRIVELDSTDERAIKLLKHERFGGKVRHRDHQFAGHGYTKVTGGWIPKLHVQIMEAEKKQDEELGTRKSALKFWQRKIGKESSRNLQSELNKIISPSLVGEIYERALEEKDAVVRSLYINAIGQVASGPAQSALIYFAINDPNPTIREQAITLVLQPQYNASASASIAASFLKSNENLHVRRAANLLRELGQIHVVNQLADALVTEHEFSTGNDPDRLTVGQQSGGTQDGSFSFGGGPKSVKRKIQNREVLDALRVITKQSFGPDAAVWKAWYTSQHTIDQIDLRSGE